MVRSESNFAFRNQTAVLDVHDMFLGNTSTAVLLLLSFCLSTAGRKGPWKCLPNLSILNKKEAFFLFIVNLISRTVSYILGFVDIDYMHLICSFGLVWDYQPDEYLCDEGSSDQEYKHNCKHGPTVYGQYNERRGRR